MESNVKMALDAIDRLRARFPHAIGTNYHMDLDEIEMALRCPRPFKQHMPSASVIADQIVQRVVELPDRSSPEDWPEAMLVTGPELLAIVTEEIEAARGKEEAQTRSVDS